jgi:serine/threonine protein kinase
LHSLSLIHADLKPENILVKSYSQCEIKLIDLGSAFFDSDPRASFVQSWSYRAPEVMVGLPYSFAIDIWSIGCILVELAVGRVLFRETTCPQMLASMESILGPFPPTLTLDGKYSRNYFLNDGRIFENNPDTVRCIDSFFVFCVVLP